MDDLKQVMRTNYLQYASYVILDRAIPNVIDGLKPVQRRILFTLWKMHDGRLHKVMNVAGQTMALHPHGDAAIIDALVNMSNKGFLLDQQGNFGNLLTGDPAAAARYIETRLSLFAMETMFNPDLTEMVPSYDSRSLEPVTLPAKVPLVLMQGVDGIAVGMSTRILPHNCVELLEAEIAILQGEEFSILPDFPTGGIMDATGYDKGRGKVKLRARIESPDPKTLVISEICYGTTTETLIRSIDEAAKRGKIKIESINDYTSDKVEIEIKLPRGQYAQELIDALYAYTECEVTLHSQLMVIRDNLPWEANVDEILLYHTELLQQYLRQELEIEHGRLLEKIFEKSLERIFIENRLYKRIENITTYEKIHETIAESLEPFHEDLLRIPTNEDRERLLNIPIRRISRFDLDKNRNDINDAQAKVEQVEKDLKSIKRYAIKYLKKLLATYGENFPRRTQFQEIEQIDLRAIAKKDLKVGFDLKLGFVGTKVTDGEILECTPFDKLLLFFKDGTYRVISIPEKQYVEQEGAKLAYVGIADKKTPLSVTYKDPKTHLCYSKRFIIKSFILDKTYRYFEEGMTLEYFTDKPGITVLFKLIPRSHQRIAKIEFPLDKVLIKASSAAGIRVSNREVKRVEFYKENRPVKGGAA